LTEPIQNEGGYRLVNVPADKDGQTYARIARNYHPNGPGWRYIDCGDMQNLELPALVRGFYRDEFWEKISGDGIASQMIAEAVFDFAVNAGVGVVADDLVTSDEERLKIALQEKEIEAGKV